MLKLLTVVQVLVFGICYAAATSCQDLQKTQLISLNERMTQMIDTLSSLLPKSLKKPPTPLAPPPTPPVDYPKSTAYETYSHRPPTYVTAQQTPQITYAAPTYTPFPAAVIVAPPVQQNPVTSLHYPQIETSSTDYTHPILPHLIPQLLPSRYEQYPATLFTNSMQITNLPLPSYQYHSYSSIQPQQATEYQYSSEYPLPLSLSVPNVSSPFATQLPYSFPVYPPSTPYAPLYPKYSELLSPQYV